MDDSWCILRCSGQNTLPLVRSLALAGFDVWAPIERVTKRVPRANIKRKVDVAMLPSYIFARARHVAELFALANDPVKDHRDFRVFRQRDRLALIADDTLAPLRLLERKVKPREETTLAAGTTVHLTDGGFAGLSGTVESSKGDYSMVRIPGFSMTIKIASFYLLRDGSESDNRQAA